MSRRSLIAVGCDVYDREAPLYGAEADARRVFEALLKPEVGGYDAASSKLLLSPDLAAIRAALREILLQPGAIDTLTFFFAGHGGVKAGSYYLLPRDASTALLSATALSASELLSVIAEAAPLQTNLIFDACDAGGVSGDIRALLRPDDLGATATPGVTVLAMAARDETALEIGEAGVGTKALLDCVEGRVFVADSRPTLDLLEIGTRVAEILDAEGEQSPVVWGLNLFGPRNFCRNPSFGGGGGPLRATLGDWEDPGTRNMVEAAMPRLWRIWDGLDAPSWSPRETIDEVGTVLASLETGEGRAQLLERLTAAGDLKAAPAVDRLRVIEVRAAILAAALPYAGEAAVARSLRLLLLDWAEQAENLVAEAVAAIDADPYAMLSSAGGISDFYVLPLRLTRIGGWAAAAYHLRAAFDPGAKADTLRAYLAAVQRSYPASLVAIGDAQASPMACILTAAHAGDAVGEGEELLGRFIASAVEANGAFASSHIEPSEILSFLIARHAGQTERVRSALAQPSELLTVLLRGASLFGIEDAIDPYLITLDGAELNAFLPDRYDGFGDELIRDGINAGYGIGRDVFTVADLDAAWRPAPAAEGEQRGLAILAALLLPDRTPWFLFPAPGPIPRSVSAGARLVEDAR